MRTLEKIQAELNSGFFHVRSSHVFSVDFSHLGWAWRGVYMKKNCPACQGYPPPSPSLPPSPPPSLRPPLPPPKDFDGKEKTVNPFNWFWCVICVRRNHLRNLNYDMVKLIWNTSKSSLSNTVMSQFLNIARFWSQEISALVFKYF